jgi:uncharacterized protein YegP (UPF0339 family)/outer membrane protein OmpA-like peptidoglycan-associated protein
MQIDSYLPCDSYLGHSESPAEDFRIFQNSEDSQHYFTMLSKSGKVVFRSEGYPTTAARDNGVASVQKNRELRERYSVVEDEGKFYLILKAGNHQEIARSCPYNSMDELNGLYPFMVAGAVAAISFDDTPAVAAIADADSDREVDNYLPCEAYAGHSDSPAEGIRTFQNGDGEYYFSVLNKNGDVMFRSEGYPTKGARDNGVASVVKNRDIKERYAEIEEDGVHYVILKAGNHQEIARSCPSKDKAGLMGLFPILGGLGLAAAAAIPAMTIPAVETPVVEVPKVVPPVVPPLAMAEPEIEAAAGGLPKWLLPVLGLLALGLLLLWFMRGCKKEPVAVEIPAVSDTIKATIDTAKAATPAVAGIQMDGFAPVVLYFENDQPNKNSQAVTTTSTYTQTFEKYMRLKSKFSAEQDTPEAKTAIQGFFDNDVKKGHEDLKDITAKIAEALKEGNKVNVTVKGFASPLAKNDYNINLTKRRISSIQNYLESYEGGMLKKYMDKISITQQANGEDSSASGLSDDEKNTKLSIYDLGPSKERRVEIVDVRFVKE